MSNIINIIELSAELNLTDAQKKTLSDAIEKIMNKYEQKSQDTNYFAGVVDGLNHAFKIINGIDDDYNCE